MRDHQLYAHRDIRLAFPFVCNFRAICARKLHTNVKIHFSTAPWMPILAAAGRSQQSRIRLVSSDPEAAPRIHPAHVTEGNDLERMVDAIIEARRISLSEPMKAIIEGTELSPGPTIPSDDREAVTEWVRSTVSTYHTVGTCAMRPDPASGAVTDTHGSMHGIDGLTVADASIMPTIPTATPNVATIMVAEHIARELRDI